MNGNIGTGMAVGIATGYIVGSAAGRQSEHERMQKISHQGEDQLLLLVKAEKDKVGSAITKLFNNWTYEDGNIIGHYNLEFDWTDVLLFGLITAILMFFLLLVLDMGNFNGLGSEYPGGVLGATITVIIISIGLAIITGRPHSSVIEYLKLGMSKDYTTVLVKKYNGSGDRTLDEDDLLRLIEILEAVNPSVNEVRGSSS